MDLAAQQNALALTVVRERLGFSTPCPGKLADFAGQGIKNLMEVQRQLLDVAARQNSILAEGLLPATAQTPIECLAQIVHQGLDCFIVAQKQFLDIIEAQAEGAANDFGSRASASIPPESPNAPAMSPGTSWAARRSSSISSKSS